ncbi:hypothetical protein [Brachybacterium paraconglomeratum]|uniref:hypothetical protein n=1 Tax=Brachybacterium paraconglomeratum TaxID=173362 RepID=UPI0022AF0721|nr:hypothetical protein [Brachybacterium paraconglomeratum]MCZ4328125.1 hypothetical protein [Brachybacterium paraconglomeratum]
MELFSEYVPEGWTRRGLEDAGYTGFRRFSALRESRPPTDPGIYVLLRESSAAPVFLEQSLATKRESFTIDAALLEREWVPDAQVVYIGLAVAGKNHDGIHRRLKQYRRTGQGTADNHSGGVWVFQLADAMDLTVCWRSEPGLSDEFVEGLEHHLIADFTARHGKLPFANRVP